MNENILSEEVQEFIASELSIRRHKIQLDTTLQDDLGVEGDVADEFFEAFAQRFDVDMSEADLGKHFMGEGADPFGCTFVLYWLFPKWLPAPDTGDKYPITVRDLITMAHMRRWTFQYPPDL